MISDTKTMLHHVGPKIYYSDDLIAEPMNYADGAVRVPDGPGMGIDVDEDKVAKYRTTELD